MTTSLFALRWSDTFPLKEDSIMSNLAVNFAEMARNLKWESAFIWAFSDNPTVMIDAWQWQLPQPLLPLRYNAQASTCCFIYPTFEEVAFRPNTQYVYSCAHIKHTHNASSQHTLVCVKFPHNNTSRHTHTLSLERALSSHSYLQMMRSAQLALAFLLMAALQGAEAFSLVGVRGVQFLRSSAPRSGVLYSRILHTHNHHIEKDETCTYVYIYVYLYEYMLQWRDCALYLAFCRVYVYTYMLFI